jgi:SARP family transcriptional regulator, regulator of embCAB operon
MAPTRIQVCGRIAVTWHGERLEQRLPARQGRLLFAFLVVRRHRAVVRDEIEAALWAGDPPEGAASAVRALLSRLRRVLGPDALEGRENVVLRLPDGAFVDLEAALEAVHRAEALVAAGNVAAAWAPARVALHTASAAST